MDGCFGGRNGSVGNFGDRSRPVTLIMIHTARAWQLTPVDYIPFSISKSSQEELVPVTCALAFGLLTAETCWLSLIALHVPG
jgi:hypothetical protein